MSTRCALGIILCLTMGLVGCTSRSEFLRQPARFVRNNPAKLMGVTPGASPTCEEPPLDASNALDESAVRVVPLLIVEVVTLDAAASGDDGGAALPRPLLGTPTTHRPD